jgi:hypothetical protein
MAPPEVTGRKPFNTDSQPRAGYWARGPPIEAVVYTITEFCVAHRISRWLYYKMKKDGTGPREMRIGDRAFISLEAAAKWRRAQERKAAAAAKAAQS